MYQQQQPIDPHDGCIHDSHAEGTFSVSLSVLAMCSFITVIIWNNILSSPGSSWTHPSGSWSIGICQELAGTSYAVGHCT